MVVDKFLQLLENNDCGKFTLTIYFYLASSYRYLGNITKYNEYMDLYENNNGIENEEYCLEKALYAISNNKDEECEKWFQKSIDINDKRNLHTLKSNATRPTSDKVKGSLFNSLGQFFDGGQVLDLYAGSGALGIEAVSRGYDEAVLVDISGQACQVIRKNVELTKEEERFKILKCSDNRAIKILQDEGNKFDLVFLDPPYAKQKIVKIMTKLLENNLLNEKALVVAETDEHDELPEVSGFSIIKDHQLGRTKVKVYERD